MRTSNKTSRLLLLMAMLTSTLMLSMNAHSSGAAVMLKNSEKRQQQRQEQAEQKRFERWLFCSIMSLNEVDQLLALAHRKYGITPGGINYLQKPMVILDEKIYRVSVNKEKNALVLSYQSHYSPNMLAERLLLVAANINGRLMPKYQNNNNGFNSTLTFENADATDGQSLTNVTCRYNYD